MKRLLCYYQVICLFVVLLSSAAASAGPVKNQDGRTLHGRPIDQINTGTRIALMNAIFDMLPKPMVDPAIDDGPVFSYFARPSFQIGVPGEPYATQLTDQGHLWTGSAELLFYAGQNLDPVSQRVWTLRKGFLPCVTASLRRDGRDIAIEVFQFWSLGVQNGLPANFIRITVGPGQTATRVGVGFMYGAGDHRSMEMVQEKFNPAWKYEMTDTAAIRSSEIIYLWDQPPDKKWAREGQGYEKIFPGTSIKKHTPVCIAEYDIGASAQSRSLTFKMPHYPLPLEQKSELAAGFENALKQFEDYWMAWLNRGMVISLPEDKVVNASRAAMIHDLMSINFISDSEIEQHVNRFQYNRFWLRDSAYFSQVYEMWGYADLSEKLLRHFLPYQNAEGNFLSQRGQLDGWGQATWSMGNYVRFTGDAAFAKEVFPAVERAVDWLEKQLGKDPWGLMPATDAFDNESITGRYTGHNFWALDGLAGAIEVARAAGREDAAARFDKIRERYYKNFVYLLRQVAENNNGVIPPGLDVHGGTDWGNLLALYPGIILDPQDPMVTSTFDHYRAEHMAEGIATWHSSLHHYVTERVAQTALIRGEQENALHDFYGMLLHTGSCHEGFEWAIWPWTSRDYYVSLPIFKIANFPPHGWYAVTYNTLLRNMLVREQGNDLHLGSALSPAWTRPGDVIQVTNASTYFGRLDMVIESGPSGAVLKYAPNWRRPPDKVLFHVPYYVELQSAAVNGSPVKAENKIIELPASGARLDLTWTGNSAPEMSYEKTVQDYKAEYKRRYEARH